MKVAFAERRPTKSEIERIRLILSSYQDGSGMLAARDGARLPGWRDFERTVALALNGRAVESKAIFDVLLEAVPGSITRYGLSCKMRGELNRVSRDGRVTVEVSNAEREFWRYLETRGISHSNYRTRAEEVGNHVLALVRSWHTDVSTEYGGYVDLSRSRYIVLLWNKSGEYRLFAYPLSVIPDASTLRWEFPTVSRKGVDVPGKRLTGSNEDGVLVEWYAESGGQLKLYPFASRAEWSSEAFRLEPLPDLNHGILNKVAAYFPDKWSKATS